VTVEPKRRRASSKGYALARFTRGGSVCISFTSRYSLTRGQELREAGRFKVRGGTGPAAKLIAGGGYLQSNQGQGWTMRGRGSRDEGPARGLPAACEKLDKQFPPN
jgi:hypothetical protein